MGSNQHTIKCAGGDKGVADAVRSVESRARRHSAMQCYWPICTTTPGSWHDLGHCSAPQHSQRQHITAHAQKQLQAAPTTAAGSGWHLDGRKHNRAVGVLQARGHALGDLLSLLLVHRLVGGQAVQNEHLQEYCRPEVLGLDKFGAQAIWGSQPPSHSSPGRWPGCVDEHLQA